MTMTDPAAPPQKGAADQIETIRAGDGLLAAGRPNQALRQAANDGLDPDLRAMLDTAEGVAEEIRTINIRRGNRVTLSFDVRVLDDERIKAIVKESTRYVPPEDDETGGGGGKRMDEFIYRLLMIYYATTDADRARFWDNPAVKARFPGVMTGTDVIERVLKPGEKIGVFNEIADICGFAFRNLPEQVEAAKNS